MVVTVSTDVADTNTDPWLVWWDNGVCSSNVLGECVFRSTVFNMAQA